MGLRQRLSIASTLVAVGFSFAGCGSSGDEAGTFSSGSAAALSSSPPSGCGTMYDGQSLGVGQSFSSCGGQYTLVMQTDGNLVLYNNGYCAVWATNTSSGNLAQMQGDGNFVLYDANANPLWSSNTGGTYADRLAVQDDGNLVVYAGGSGLWGSNTARNAIDMCGDEITDYLTQDVCLDGAGNLTGDDPYSCGSKRDMGEDEPVQFLLHDTPDANYPLGHQATVSAPIRLGPPNNGTVGILHTFDFGGDSASSFLEYNPTSGNISSINPNGGFPSDGWDVVEHNGGYASYIGTADGGGGIQDWVHWTNGPGTTVYDDAWLIWDQSRVSYAPTFDDAVATCNNGFETTPPFMNQGYTWWQVQPSYTFTSGKVMDTLVTHHFAANTIAGAGSYEVDYYTKPYGRTRWEAWNRTPTGSNGNCDGPTDDGQGFTRVDCRDWSFGSATPDGGWYAVQYPVYYQQAKGNWLMNGDFGSNSSNFSDAGGYFNWGRNNNPNWTVTQEFPGATSLRQGNHLASLASTDGQWGSIYQDIPANGAGPGWWFTFGARVWSDQDGQPATLRAWRIRADGSTEGYSDINITANSESRPMQKSWFAFDSSDVVTIRLELYGFGTATYHLDDAFVTQT